MSNPISPSVTAAVKRIMNSLPEPQGPPVTTQEAIANPDKYEPRVGCWYCGYRAPRSRYGNHECPDVKALRAAARKRREDDERVRTTPVTCLDCGTKNLPGSSHVCRFPVDLAAKAQAAQRGADMAATLAAAGYRLERSDEGES